MLVTLIARFASLKSSTSSVMDITRGVFLTEILCGILQYLERTDLYPCLTVNRQFHVNSIPFLYRDVTVAIGHSHDDPKRTEILNVICSLGYFLQSRLKSRYGRPGAINLSR
jgi:hypothetical protein